MELENLKSNVVSQMPKHLSTMCKLEKWLETKEQSPPKEVASPSTIQDTLEIHPGSGVCVPKNVLWSASHANSPTTMARMLLLGVFDIDTLLKSNLRASGPEAGSGVRLSKSEEAFLLFLRLRRRGD